MEYLVKRFVNTSQEMVVRPSALKSLSKDKAGIFLSSPKMRTRVSASKKEIFLSLLKRLKTATAC